MAYKPVVVSDFKGLGTRWAAGKVPPKMLVQGHNIRFQGTAIKIRPGLSPAIIMPLTPEVEVGTRNFQIEMLGTGIARVSGDPAYTFYRSSKTIHPSRIPGGSYQLEAVYENNNASDWGMSLIDPNGAILDTLALPNTNGTGYPYWTRKRSDNVLTLSTDGVYKLRCNAGLTNTPFVFRARLVVAQLNPTRTVEHYPLLVATGGSSADVSGITGPDTFRTHEQFYNPNMSLTASAYDEGGNEKFNFVWFKYIAAEWPNLDYCQLEMISDGFAPTSYGALYYVDPTTSVQTLVPGSEITHSNAAAVPESAMSAAFSMVGQPDGYYAVRFKSSSNSANAFFNSAWLHLVSVSSGSHIRGNTYWVIGNGEHAGQCKSLPTLAYPTKFETCTFHNLPQGNTFVTDSGTSDAGEGTEIPATDLYMGTAYTKIVDRSVDVFASLPAGHRFNGDNNQGIGIQSFLNEAYDVATSV